MALRGTPGAQVLATQEPRVEALQQLGIDLPSRHPTERRIDVQADKVVVLLTSGDPELRHLEPLLESLSHGDG